MAPPLRLLAALAAALIMLSGCFVMPDDDDNETDVDADDASHGQDDANDDGEGGAGSGGKAGSSDDGDEGGDDGGGSGDADDRECHEHEPPVPVPPPEQEVASSQELLCPGHFVVLEEGTGDGWAVPDWQTGQWWRYERRQINQTMECHFRVRETVAGSGELWQVPVYRMDHNLTDCGNEPAWSFEGNRTKHSLTEFGRDAWSPGTDDGYVNHRLLFPLKDGKKWAFVNAANKTVEVHVAHEPDHLFNPWATGAPNTPAAPGAASPRASTTDVDAGVFDTWRVNMTIGNTLLDQWYSVEHGNLLEDRWQTRTGFVYWRTQLMEHGP